MPLPTHSNAQRSAGSGPWTGPGTGPFNDPSNFNEVFLGAFRRDVQSFYPGSRIEREPAVFLAGSPAGASGVTPTFALDFSSTRKAAGRVNRCGSHSSASGTA